MEKVCSVRSKGKQEEKIIQIITHFGHAMIGKSIRHCHIALQEPGISSTVSDADTSISRGDDA